MKMLKNLMADRKGLTDAGRRLMNDVSMLENARVSGNMSLIPQLERKIIDEVCALKAKYGHYIEEL